MPSNISPNNIDVIFYSGMLVFASTFSTVLVQGMKPSPDNYDAYKLSYFSTKYGTRFFVRQGTERLFYVAMSFFSLGGTCFYGSDLTSASFCKISLKNTSFLNSRRNEILLDRVRWKDAKNMGYVNFEKGSILRLDQVRELLITLDGKAKNFYRANLEGVNLDEANLRRIDLRGANLNNATLQLAEMSEANLSKANLRFANLFQANLTAAQCIGTDFTSAYLTGICLEAWNIYDTTILKDVDCQYVFLKRELDARGNRDRHPYNPEKTFQPGDFEIFFQEMVDTVQILIREGIYPSVFQATLQELIEKYDLAPDPVRGYERKGKDSLVTIAVPTQTDKGEFERDFDELHALKLKMAKTQGLLQGERKRADTLEKLLDKRFTPNPTITIENNPIMSNSTSSFNTGDGGFINTGSMQGNVVNLGKISGQVTVQINQLPDTVPDSDQPNLKSLLTQLQQATEADTELSEMEKAEALGEVAKLAKAGTNPKDNAMQRMAKRATDALKSITEPLTEASKLAEVCQSLLPAPDCFSVT